MQCPWPLKSKATKVASTTKLQPKVASKTSKRKEVINFQKLDRYLIQQHDKERKKINSDKNSDKSINGSIVDLWKIRQLPTEGK